MDSQREETLRANGRTVAILDLDDAIELNEAETCLPNCCPPTSERIDSLLDTRYLTIRFCNQMD
ncbi:MAG TPA: hypothetical protein DIC56_00100 [Rhizobium sp.]|nr:hypothetical protein [Rhizobium sp.]